MRADGEQRIIAVVVTFNRLALVRRLVERLVTVPGLQEILVVDNASTDGTSDWLANLESIESHEVAAQGPAPDHGLQPRRAPGASTTAWPGPSTAGRTWPG